MFCLFLLHFPTVGRFFLTGQKKIWWLETGMWTLGAVSFVRLFTRYELKKVLVKEWLNLF